MLINLAGLSLRDLEYATAVAELRHFGKAAERCGVSQPALSEQIRKLEALLGHPLFERTGRRVLVLPDSEALLAQAARVVAEARNLVEMARSEERHLTGLLRLGAIATLAPYYLPFLLADIRPCFPGLILQPTEGHTDALLTELQRGALDAVLVATATGPGIEAAPLFFEPFRLACPPGEAAPGGEVTAAQLRRMPLLLLEEGHCLRDQALDVCPLANSRKAGAAGTRFASSLEMLRAMVAAGEGRSLLPALAADDPFGPQGLVAYRPLADAGIGRTVTLAWRATDPRARHFHELASFLREHAPAGTAPAPLS